MKYIIDKTIVFIPKDGLYLVTSETVEFKLSLVADSILLLLITLKGATISRQEIHDYLWKECSLDVSTASINNNISYLRRYFKEMGVIDFIVTIPKLGISIKQGTCVELFSQEKFSVEEQSDPDPVYFDRKRKKLTTVVSIILFMLVLIGTSLYSFVRYSMNESMYYIGSIHDCKVFSLESLSEGESGILITSANKFIEEKLLKCEKNTGIIANSQARGFKYIRGSRDFFAVCEFKKNHLYSCDSYYYLGGVN